jgi:hypothetical protein
VVIITRTAAQNEYICRVAAATLMNRKATPSQIPWLLIGPACLFMAPNGHATVVAICPLLGAERKTCAPGEYFRV